MVSALPGPERCADHDIHPVVLLSDEAGGQSQRLILRSAVHRCRVKCRAVVELTERLPRGTKLDRLHHGDRDDIERVPVADLVALVHERDRALRPLIEVRQWGSDGYLAENEAAPGSP
jgi:hypothetical protein